MLRGAARSTENLMKWGRGSERLRPGPWWKVRILYIIRKYKRLLKFSVQGCSERGGLAGSSIYCAEYALCRIYTVGQEYISFCWHACQRVFLAVLSSGAFLPDCLCAPTGMPAFVCTWVLALARLRCLAFGSVTFRSA